MPLSLRQHLVALVHRAIDEGFQIKNPNHPAGGTAIFLRTIPDGNDIKKVPARLAQDHH
jgi:hypothetical protein